MDAPAILDRIRAAFPEAVVGADPAAKDPWVQVQPAVVVDVLRLLRDDGALAFDCLMSLTGLDLTGLAEPNDLRVVYHLYSYPHRHALAVRVDLPRDNPVVPSATGVYPAADWAEREALDLVGITFTGHPDPRRLLLPPEWEGHPLRKDYVQGPTALGFPTTRRCLLDELRGAGEK